jgi:hypothetical protein
MHGPMLETFFGRSTFDGYTTIRPNSSTPIGCEKDSSKPCTGNGGYILGYNKIVGSVRIAQLRSKPMSCVLPKAVQRVSGDYEWTCFERTSSAGVNNIYFEEDTESKEDFSVFKNGQAYTYNGVTDDGHAVTDESMWPQHERDYGRFSWYRSLRKRILYPAPA